jgi:hypothetical protein
MSNWKVTAVLSSPLAGDAPYIDALLEFEMAHRHGIARRINRNEPAPPIGSVHIPCLRGEFGEVNGIPRCSAPILAPTNVRHEHYAKRISVENAGLLREDQRLVVATGNSWTKSYRLPNKDSNVDRVCWFVGGSKRRNLKSLLDSVHSIGKDVSQGYGRIAEWQFEEVEHDWSWFAPSEQGTLLMRVLPWCDDIQKLIGWKRWCGGVAAPYWHPDRIMEVAVPC